MHQGIQQFILPIHRGYISRHSHWEHPAHNKSGCSMNNFGTSGEQKAVFNTVLCSRLWTGLVVEMFFFVGKWRGRSKLMDYPTDHKTPSHMTTQVEELI